MLVFTGFRLGSPREFIKMWQIGWEQFLIFTTTILVVLCTDLLIGVLAGIVLKIVIQLCLGVPPSAYWHLDLESSHHLDATTLRVKNACVFSTWLKLRGKILEAVENGPVTLDLSDAKYVDHSTMEKLHELERDLESQHKVLKIVGLDGHQAISSHALSARRRVEPAPEISLTRRVRFEVAAFFLLKIKTLDFFGLKGRFL